ncbi:Putative uncharacterized protein OS=Ralstonia solanacearum K60-1 GN=RSK60_1520044 PE=4 SV=1 [Gemmataceae bacterium]|nr:Putative uncharacterized protein OS=Ralstonia solanacearum K60-1 GN=RSK60_1520044 PE=4 SV=1 [Gemmataceae bacterium]VTT98928.1 Putative uncharacterized protein OS=Ralstonia solanacearum K60-1 GN=RSK60_1520044 PE=4 SV=1 [Gemmataceae bacterium]
MNSSSPHPLLSHLPLALEREIARRAGLFEWGRRYLPHFLKKAPSRFHLEFCGDLERLRTARGSRLARLAPRGSAKSTWGTLVHPLRCAVEGTEPFTLILSDTQDQASDFLTQIKAELEDNPRLAAAYPGACGVGPEWRASRLRLNNGCVIEAKSRGGRIRGRRNRQDRPSLVIVDDCQGNRDIISPIERKRGWDWMTREVIPSGEEGSTSYVSVGTALHRECVAVRLLTTPGWAGKVYRSVERWPDRTDLWDEWERHVTNLADADRDRRAREFFLARAGEMTAGSEVLWPEGRDLYALMRRRAEIGPSAFDTEDQGNPNAAEGAEWPAEYFDRPGFWFDRFPDDIVLRVQTLDPSKGTGDRPGDYQAHVLAALATDGTLYVDCQLRREPDYVGRLIDLARDWTPNVVVAEANNTMGLILVELERQLADRRAANRPVLLNYDEITHTAPKLARMRGLTKYLARGQIRVRNTPHGRMLVDQMRDVPTGEHDDGPDALATAVRRIELLTAV